MKRKLRTTDGFTLVELVVVLFVVALLAATAFGGLAGGGERSKRLGCLGNLRQLALGSQLYAQDDSLGRLTGSLKPSPFQQQADDDMNWLYGFGLNWPPGYVRDPRLFCCPATRNNVNTNSFAYTLYPTGGTTLIRLINDLSASAAGNQATSGHSYEVLGCWNSNLYPRKTLGSVLSYGHQNAPYAGTIAGPSHTIVFIDEMNPHPPVWVYENWPNSFDGHGAEGGNVSFADGHCEWIAVENWRATVSFSQDYTSMWSFPPGY